MSIVTIFEGEDVNCTAKMKGVKYKSTSTAKFVFKRVDNDQVLGEVTAQVKNPTFGYRVANGTWKSVDVPDELMSYLAKYELVVDGKTYKNFPHQVQVWARSIEVTTKKQDDSPLSRTVVSFRQDAAPRPGGGRDRKGDLPSTMTSEGDTTAPTTAVNTTRSADPNGKITWELTQPGPVRTEVELPYRRVGDWVNPDGRKREVKAARSFTARIIWPVARRGEGEIRQYVNRDPKVGFTAFGPEVEVTVTATVNAHAVPGDLVHYKAEFDANNSPRTPRPGESAPGAVTPVQTVAIDANRRAKFRVRMGPAGGDKVTIKVGATSACEDDSVTVTSWRRLDYQLIAPAMIVAELPARTMPNGSAGFDLLAATTEHVKSILDPVFIEYKVLSAASVPDASYPAHQKLAGNFFVPAKPRQSLVLDVSANGLDTPVAFPGGDSRVMNIRVCDAAVALDATVTAGKTLTQARSELAPDPNSRWVFKLKPRDGTPTLISGTWTAEVDPSAVADTHPGLDGGVPRTGLVPQSWLTHLTRRKIRIDLPNANPGDPGSFVGALDADHCPVKVTLEFWCPKFIINGCANGSRQLMVFGTEGAKCSGSTLCHELGHSMGMTIMPGRNKVPYGMPAAKHVGNGGSFYRNVVTGEAADHAQGLKTCHQGAHCADGVGDKTPDNLDGGTCIMFGAGRSKDPPTQLLYCAECVKYLKARNIDDISTSFASRPAENC